MADSLLSEVDADLRAERMAQLWLRYRLPLLSLIIAVILATTANVLWHRHQEKRGGELLQQFTAAQTLYTEGNFKDAASGFAAIAEATHGETHSLAELWQARALNAAGQKPEAVALLQKTSEQGSGLWADLACLRLASLENETPSCLAAKKETPLVSQRREWQAAAAWAAGDQTGAIAILEQVATSPDTAEPTRARVSQWLATMRTQKAAQ